MLKTENLSVSIGGAPILRGVSLQMQAGSMMGLIGRNGAGKTTFMRTVMGLIKPDQGRVLLGDIDLLAVEPHLRASLGIGYMPEDRRLVPNLTVADNIMIPAWATKSTKAAQRLDWLYSLIPEIAEFSDRPGMALSGGQQKLVALARALMVGSQLLLLDEPFEGIAPALSMRLVEIILALKSEGISVLISESDYTHTKNVVSASFVIERGVIRQHEQPANESRSLAGKLP